MVVIRSRPSNTIATSLTAICFSALIYVAYAPKSLLVFHWLSLVHAEDMAEQVRHSAFSIPSWVRHNLPDGLWVYAATLALSLPWKGGEAKRKAMIWLSAPLILATGAEFGQALHFVKGTFDPLDLMFYFLGSLAALLQILRRQHAVS